MTLRMAAPALVTLIALACGLAAIEAAHAGEWGMALRFIMLAAVAGPIELSYVQAVIVAIVLAALMVSRVPFPMLKFGWSLILPALIAAVIPIAIANSVQWLAFAAMIGLGIYVVIGVANAISDRMTEAVPEDVREDAPAHT